LRSQSIVFYLIAQFEASKKLKKIYSKKMEIATQMRDGKPLFQINLATRRQVFYNGISKPFLAIRAGDLFEPPVKLS
jgi:hypothetical protein